MSTHHRSKKSRRRGSALVTSFITLTLLAIAASSYIDSATHSIRTSVRQTQDIQATHLCEAGVQAVLRGLWRPFKVDQDFVAMEDSCAGASANAPRFALSGSIPEVGGFSAGVVRFYSPGGDPYSRMVTVRAVGWLDRDSDGQLDDNEPRKVVDVTARFELARSQVFDYTYFINNYGWMDGFNQNDLIVNGDMRANGNMDFLNGSPTVNGTAIASNNDKLSPAAAGNINTAPVKWSNSTYATTAASNPRMRQAYNSGVHGEKGSSTFDTWRDFVFDSDASVVNNRVAGAALMDASGSKAWTRTSQSNTATLVTLDTAPTKEVIMPDLSDIGYYVTQSTTYLDTKQFFSDGTANPGYNQGAYIEVWDQTLNGGAGAYKRVTTNGVLNGSAILVGSSSKPIKIHGPVTFLQDAVIKGYVSGQGTIYTGRNVHIVGSIQYTNPPDFRGSDMEAIDRANEKKDMLALAARQSIIMGNPKTFANPYPLKYMTPPFTKGRYDEAGNWIPPFDATQTDSSGFKKYQSVLGNDALNAIASGINQIDAILYTNFVGGGNVGTGGGGVKMNGTIISKDEAIVTWSLPVVMNYDNRIRERGISRTPLIDLKLPRSPVMLRSTWQDRGFKASGTNPGAEPGEN